jgi:hypothetical protein
MYVKEGETAQIDLSGSENSVTISWVKSGERPSGNCSQEGSGLVPASLEVTLISSSNIATRSYYNAYQCDLNSRNHFTNATNSGSGGFGSLQTIAIPASAVSMRIKPLYNGTTIKVAGNGLTSQLYLITSNAEGGDSRTDIEARRSLNGAGAIFDYAVFSNSTIIK